MKSSEASLLILKTKNMSVAIHQHMAYQIVLAIEKPFDTEINETKYEEIFGFIIKPNVSHSCLVNNSSLLIINIETNSTYSSKLNSILLSNPMYIFKSQLDIAIILEIESLGSGFLNVNELLESKTFDTHQIADERVKLMHKVIHEKYFEHLSLEYFSDLLSLSESRLSRIFREQMGTNFTNYIQWTRLKHAILDLLQESKLSLTEIALKNGFYDLPQFNKYTKKMIGVSPKMIRKHSELIQVY